MGMKRPNSGMDVRLNSDLKMENSAITYWGK